LAPLTIKTDIISYAFVFTCTELRACLVDCFGLHSTPLTYRLEFSTPNEHGRHSV